MAERVVVYFTEKGGERYGYRRQRPLPQRERGRERERQLTVDILFRHFNAEGRVLPPILMYECMMLALQ